MLRLIGLIVPLCLDTFAVSAAIGMTGLKLSQRVRLGLLFATFEGGMPLIGLGVGAALGHLVGDVADYVAVAALAGIGLYMLTADDEREEARVRLLANATGVAAIGLGLSISLDEFAIGFTLGLVRVPVAAAVILIALQAFVVSQIGFQLGHKVGERFREVAERAAGVVLLALAGILFLSKLVHLPLQ